MPFVVVIWVVSIICSLLQLVIVIIEGKKCKKMKQTFTLSTHARNTLLIALFIPPFVYFVFNTGADSFFERLWTSVFSTWILARPVPLVSIIALIMNKRNEKRRPNV